MSQKIAVIAFNLGGPDKIASVKPFLFNLFYDKAIIRMSNPWRFLIAYIISSLRKKESEKIYSYMGGKSPILGQTMAQAEAIQDRLDKESSKIFKVFCCMRYWYPQINDIIDSIKKFEASKIILLSLYPQYSTTTTASSIENIKDILKKQDITVPVVSRCCYFNDKLFIKSHLEIIKKILPSNKNYVILFSAHSLPQKIIDDKDPYQWQIEQTIYLIMRELKNIKYNICYQSKVLSADWLYPSTETLVTGYAKKGINIILVPIAFVSEHAETLVELDIEYYKIAQKYNIEYIRVTTVGINEYFISSLVNTVINLSKANYCYSRQCPSYFDKCPNDIS